MECGDYKITNLEYSQFEELVTFMESSDFLWSDVKLLKYILFTLNDTIEDNIVVLYRNKIIGCNLFITSIVSICGEIRKIRWSHSTYLLPEHRKYIGLQLFYEVNNLNDIWGFGLTSINRKLHKLNKTLFLTPSRAYVLNLDKYNNISQHDQNYYPPKFEVHNLSFEKCYSAKDHVMPNNGFWNKEIVDVDFIRDNEYMSRRFYNSPINYHIYKVSQKQECDLLYFVVRIRVIKGVKYLFLVDYRFKVNTPLVFTYIIDAFEFLARNNGISKGYIFTTLPANIIEQDIRLESYGTLSDIICNSEKVDSTFDLFVTPSDSDCDLIPIS